MDTKNRTTDQAPTRATVPQMQVRSDVRSGGDLETCQANLSKWRDRYYYWYNVAKQAGKI